MGPLARYQARVLAGEIERDPAQHAVAAELDELARALAAWRPAERGLLSVFRRVRPAEAPRGLYIYGAVGRGKTMLMDIFHEAAAAAPKRRVHFHAFMADVHERIAKVRARAEGDPIPSVAAAIASEAALLCFDELHVTDIADAMILGRLFKGLFAAGLVVVATSNAAPQELYRDGLNRQLFLPFVDLIEDRMAVVELAAAKDFRLAKLAGQPLYFTPADAAASRELDRAFARLTGGQASAPLSLEVKGRRIEVPRAAMGVARFGFADLCERPLGTHDYLEIAHAFHTLLIDRIPILAPARRNEARRFVNLIDTLYDNRIGLLASAEAEPHALYPSGDGADLFERTASRLIEMRSEAYLAGRAARRGRQAVSTAS
jgi:cell division protein ZapE